MKKFRWDLKAQRMIGWWECMATARLLPFSGTSCHLTPNSTHAVNTPRLLVRIQCSPPFCCRSDNYSWLFCLQYHATFCLLCKYSMLLKGWQSNQFQSPNGQAVHGPDWWTTSSSLASLLPLGLPYHGSTFEHGQFVATTCPHKMSSIIPQQQLHILKHERHQPLYGLSLEQHPSLWSNSITIISQNIKITPVLTKSVDWKADSSDVLGLSQNENLTGS